MTSSIVGKSRMWGDKRRTLYILGNGFDFAHGLDTKYWDFRTFLAENHPEFLLEFEKLYNIWPLDDTEPWYNEKAQQRCSPFSSA